MNKQLEPGEHVILIQYVMFRMHDVHYCIFFSKKKLKLFCQLQEDKLETLSTSCNVAMVGRDQSSFISVLGIRSSVFRAKLLVFCPKMSE